MACWCTQGIAKIASTGNLITLSPALFKQGPSAAALGMLFQGLLSSQTQKLLRLHSHLPSAPYSPISLQRSPSGSLEMTPFPLVHRGAAWGGGLPRHLPSLYVFQSFNLSPQVSPSSPFMALAAVPKSSNLPAVMRWPVPSTVLQVRPPRVSHGATAALLTHPRLLFSLFFFFPFSDHHSKLKQHGKAKQRKSKSNA